MAEKRNEIEFLKNKYQTTKNSINLSLYICLALVTSFITINININNIVILLSLLFGSVSITLTGSYFLTKIIMKLPKFNSLKTKIGDIKTKKEELYKESSNLFDNVEKLRNDLICKQRQIEKKKETIKIFESEIINIFLCNEKLPQINTVQIEDSKVGNKTLARKRNNKGESYNGKRF